MEMEILTKGDLEQLKIEIFAELKVLFTKFREDLHTITLPDGIKTIQARKLLDCSNGKLLSLRSEGKVRCKKIGGTLYYNREDIRKLMKSGTRS